MTAQSRRLPRTLKKQLEASLVSLTAREAGRLLLLYYQEARAKNIPVPSDYPPIKKLNAAWDARLEAAKKRGPAEYQAEGARFNGYKYLGLLIAVANTLADGELWRIVFLSYTARQRVDTLLYQDAVSEIAHKAIDGLVRNMPRPVSRADYDRIVTWAKTDALDTLADVADHAAVRAKRAETLQTLADMLAAGKLTGGPAFDLPGLWSPVLIRDGKLPAWVGLRFAWDDWTYDRGVFEYDLPNFLDDKAPDGTWALYDADGDLTGDRLTALVGDFVKDCRSRPWGKPLPRKPDLPALAAWLTAVESPLTQIDAPDLGLIDWETFRSSEGDESAMWEPKPAATVASLTKALYEGEGDTRRVAELEESYYPTERAHDQQRGLHNIIARLYTLRSSHRAFTYREQPKPGELSMQEFLGMEFFTPLEEAVKLLGEAQGQFALFRRVYDALSDKYFGGLPILAEEHRECLDMLDQLLTGAGENLVAGLDYLARWPWSVDTTTLTLTVPPIDESEVAAQVELDERFARIALQDDKDCDIDLGEDELPPDKANGRKGAKP